MEYAPSNRKRLPYGMMNFADIRFDNYYYVDKTAFIPLHRTVRTGFLLHPSPAIWQKSDLEHAATLL